MGILRIVIHISLITNLVQSQVAIPTNGTVDYSRLNLDHKYLLGSRWAPYQKSINRTVFVYFTVEVLDIVRVDVQSMSIRVELFLRERWSSRRMKIPDGLFDKGDPPNSFIVSPPEVLTSMWSPNAFISGARESQIASLGVEQASVHIFSDSSIQYQARLFTQLGCSFDFKWFPLDKQECDLIIESYDVKSDIVQYVWDPEVDPPVTYNPITLFQYILIPSAWSNGTNKRFGTDPYSFVSIRFKFERQISYTIVQVFVPTTLIVIMSWFSFWLGFDAIPGRIGLLITSMLTIVTMHVGAKGSGVPPVSYIKMMDIWMIGCMAFVFMALCEFVIVKFIHWRKQKELEQSEERQKKMEAFRSRFRDQEEGRLNVPQGERGQNRVGPLKTSYNHSASSSWLMEDGRILRIPFPFSLVTNANNGHKFLYPQLGPASTHQQTWTSIDNISKFLFPACFLIFNGVFWPILIIGSGRQ